jgi:penicillin-binding protein 1C
MALSRRTKFRLILGLSLPASWLIVRAFCILFPPDLPVAYSREILDEKGRLLYVFLSKDQKWRLSTTENEIPSRLSEWMIWKEDQYFFLHPGINPVSVLKSALENFIAGKRKSGASTITMQAVKLCHPAARTWKSKIRESLQALYWEMALSKKEILAFYFSHLPFGGNVEGFRSASRIYFGKELRSLSPAQWAALVVIPNKPGKNHPLLNPEQLTLKRNEFLSRLFKAGKMEEDEYKSAILEPFFARRHEMPRLIPHLARQFQTGAENKVRITLNADIHLQAAQLIQYHHTPLKMKGINNAALLLADIESGEIKAWTGNPDFADAENSGQVDGVLALRSPGSTLKPFLFALGFQKGIITPKSVFYDIPSEYQDYAPENYDQKFHGAVTAEDALLLSLNIPAIELLEKVQVDTFLHYLDKMGMNKLLEKTRQPGLSMAVGGCGTNLFELVQSYRILALGGQAGKISLYKEDKENSSKKQILEPGSAKLVNQILSMKNRGEVIFSLGVKGKDWENFVWKTGTSYRRKDAWCIGFGHRYVLGIWLGNFSGQGNAALSGIDAAAPLFQKIISELERNCTPLKRKSPLESGWKIREVCAETGQKPGPWCHKTTTDYFLPMVSSQHICQHRKAFLINPEGSLSFCGNCKSTSGQTTATFDNPDPGWRFFSEQEGKKFQLPPPHNPDCRQPGGESAPQFLFPMEGKVYFLNGAENLKTGIRLQAPAEAFPLRVFENGRRIGESKKGEEIPVSLNEGAHQFSAVGQNGSLMHIRFRVMKN